MVCSSEVSQKGSDRSGPDPDMRGEVGGESGSRTLSKRMEKLVTAEHESKVSDGLLVLCYTLVEKVVTRCGTSRGR